jgi:Ribonuclease G/E
MENYDKIYPDSSVAFKSTTKVVNKLMKEIIVLKKELYDERQQNKKLYEKLNNYLETADANINRTMFNDYVYAVKDRRPTSQEWRKFIDTFFFDLGDLHKKIYAWIELNIN